MDIDQFAHALGVIFCRPPCGDLDVAPGPMHVDADKEIDGAVAAILAIVAFELAPGGFAQAVATSSASSLPVSLRSAPGRGSSLSARSRLPSTKRRLVRYTVEPLTATVRAISSSLQPASAASNIWARLSLRAARLPPRNIAVSSQRSAWFSSTR